MPLLSIHLQPHFPTSNAEEETHPFLPWPQESQAWYHDNVPGHNRSQDPWNTWVMAFQDFLSNCNSNLMNASNRAIDIGEEFLVSLRERVIPKV